MALPWTQLLRWAPQIITLSRELMLRSQRPPEGAAKARAEGRSDLEPRVAALEDNERRQAELVERMAEQQAEMARALIALHKRQRLLLVAIGVLAIVAVLLAWGALL